MPEIPARKRQIRHGGITAAVAAAMFAGSIQLKGTLRSVLLGLAILLFGGAVVLLISGYHLN